MTQEETIKMLDSISPDIISSKDPEGTMLKCASKNNLSPAQLEHLGQVYNTTKSVTGFEVMNNRGDSFAIVDVPSMVSKYASYDPAKKVSEKSKGIQDALNDSMASSFEVTIKMAHARKRLPNLQLAALSTMISEDDEDNTVKSASTKSPAELVQSVEQDIADANELFEQALFDANEDIREKCAYIMQKLSPDEGRWEEVKADVQRIYGEKSASAIARIENFFSYNGHHTEPAKSVTKRAGFGNLVQDRHGVLDQVNDIIDLTGFLEKYATHAPGPQPKPKQPVPPGDTPAEKTVNLPTFDRPREEHKRESGNTMSLDEALNPWGKAVGSVTDVPSVIGSTLDKTFSFEDTMIKRIGATSDERQKKIDKDLAAATKETTLAQLMLNDKVISSYDPEEVQDMYENLAALSPALAKNPTMMAAALKEALQYGSIPVPIAKGIADLQKTITENERNQRMIDRDKYQY